MATSEHIRKTDSSGTQAPRLAPQAIFSSERVAGPGFVSKVFLMLGDAFVVSAAFVFAVVIRAKFFPNLSNFKSLRPASDTLYLGFFAWFLVVLVLGARRYGLYNPIIAMGGFREQHLTVRNTLNAGLLLCGGLYMAHWDTASRSLVILLICTTIAGLCIWRATIRLSRYRNYEKGIDTRNVVVLGTNYLSDAVGQHIAANYRLGYQFLGYVAPSESDHETVVADQSILGGIEWLHQLTRLHFIDEVVIAQVLPSEQLIAMLDEARELGVDIRAISGLYGDIAANAPIEYLGVYPVVSLHRSQSKAIALIFKRVSDLVFSLSALIAFFPIMLIVALAVRLDGEGPILYISERIGKRGRVFPCFKFRTMVKDAENMKKELVALNERDSILFKVSNDPRVTRVGHFLRKYSLDELPQLFNVLCGEMSLVGPRPPIACEVEKYELEHFRRLEVMPGLTGLWQVQARQDGSFTKYIELDTAYVENWSFWLDARILLRTVHVVLRGTGT